jgi:hypothetical protein
MHHEIGAKEIEKGVYKADVTSEDIMKTTKPLVNPDKLTQCKLRELSPGMYVAED